VVATSGVQDLSGNALANFQSQFTTAASFDTSHASVVSQRPGNGATGVPLNSSIVLFVNEALNQGTIAGALHISQNGVVVNGTVQSRDNGQTIEFVPAVQWQNGALIQVFLDNTAVDTDGSPVNGYQASFRTMPDTSAIPPQVVSTSPVNGATKIPLNPVIELQYNEPLALATVNTTNVFLTDASGKVIPSTVTLDPTGELIRLVPNATLGATAYYYYDTTTGIKGVNGLAQTGLYQPYFQTGTAADNVAPTVLLVSPPDQSVNVPVNANIRVRFSKPINPLLSLIHI